MFISNHLASRATERNITLVRSYLYIYKDGFVTFVTLFCHVLHTFCHIHHTFVKFITLFVTFVTLQRRRSGTAWWGWT